MKKYLFISLPFISSFCLAQNVQLHYDFGKQEDGTVRNYAVGTFEMYRPDTFGYTFMFVDFEFDSPDKPRGVSMGYFEIGRSFYIPWFRNNKILSLLEIHGEFNDGSVIYSIDSSVYGENLRSSWLVGLDYPFRIGKFVLNTQVMYKYIRGSEAPDFQLTFSWLQFFLKDKITLSGFFDFWCQDDFDANPSEKIFVAYGEPQIWYNFTKKFALGSEFKISRNFVYGSDRIEIFPTLGMKYEF